MALGGFGWLVSVCVCACVCLSQPWQASPSQGTAKQAKASQGKLRWLLLVSPTPWDLISKIVILGPWSHFD